VLVIHGTDDEVIGFWHGQRLYARAAEPKQRLWVQGATHNDLAWVAGDRYWAALRAFADGLGTVDTGEGGT
jgi:abhydrolase domain-containing protein 17